MAHYRIRLLSSSILLTLMAVIVPASVSAQAGIWRALGPEGGVVALEIHPLDGTIYAADETVFKSTDGGRSWRALGPPATIRDVVALGLDPTSSAVVYVGDSTPCG